MSDLDIDAITIVSTPTGEYQTTVGGHSLIKPTVDELIRELGLNRSGRLRLVLTFDSDDADDEGFERDLDQILAKNAELYRRLAR
jgi:hypothetical protein